MATKTKGDLAAQVKRLQKSLERAKATNAARGKSLAESHERQAATGEILRIISRSPGDAQPVFDAIAGAALRLVGGASVSVVRVSDKMLHLAAFTSTNEDGDETLRTAYPRPVSAEGGHNQSLRLRAPYYVSDVSRLPKRQKTFREVARARGFRSAIFVPLLRDGAPIGSIGVTHRDPGAFSDEQIALLETFAEQAVIAIENTRLFNEAKQSLEQQTAIGEILRVMSASPTDVRPVLDTVAERAATICEANDVRILLVDNDVLRYSAGIGTIDGQALGETRPIDRRLVTGRAVLDRIPIQVDDLSAIASRRQYPLGSKLYKRFGHRTVFAMPLLREGRALGVILLRRMEVRPFNVNQIALLKTFADQAAIAIENVRLFNETQEALERQTATAEVLRVISSSPGTLEPVHRTILEGIGRLCEANIEALFLYDGEALSAVATHGTTLEFAAHLESSRPRPSQETTTRLCALERRVVHVADLLADDSFTPQPRDLYERENVRTVLSVPMVRDDGLVGVITAWRREVRPFTDRQIDLVKTFADQAVIAIENVRLFNELKARNADLTEALDQQTATAKILQVISSSPTDIQPVLDAVAASAARLCDATDVMIRQVHGDAIRVAAHVGPVPVLAATLTRDITRDAPGGRAILERRTMHIPDVLDPQSCAEFPQGAWMRHPEGTYRTMMVVPMVREDVALGIITIRRTEVRPFSDKQIRLLETFAAQAVIAIENVRLFNELEARNAELSDALEQQTATAEILQVISGSPNDVQPVFKIILENAVRICSANFGTIFRFDGMAFHRAASVGTPSALIEFQRRRGPFVPESSSKFDEMLRTKRVCHALDAAADDVPSVSARFGGARSQIHVPLLKDNELVGAIVIYRQEVMAFTDKQIELVKSFAAQAVIAIENVRMFKELQARNAEITEALEQQTATSEILRVISSSPTDTGPVFTAIVQSGARLFAGANISLRLVKGEHIEFVASSQDRDRTVFSINDDRLPSTRAIQRKEVLVVDDMLTEDWIAEEARARAKRRGFRGLIAAPLMRAGEAIGTIAMNRAAPGPFTEGQIDLLKTFADQAVIAIENVRLFNELQARNADLTEALEQQTATVEILGVISSSPTDIQPVLDAVVASAARLCDARDVMIRRVDGEVMRVAAHIGSMPIANAAMSPPLSLASISGRAIVERRTIQVDDVLAPGVSAEYPGAMHLLYENSPFRTVLVAPLLRDDVAIGAIALRRTDVRPFSDKQIKLLETFAAQAVIAIENVRLFKELQARNAEISEALEQQTATAKILHVISSSPTDLQPVFDAILDSARRLCEAHRGALHLFDGEVFTLVADQGATSAFSQYRERERVNRPGPLSGIGQVGEKKCVIHIHDLAASPAYVSREPMTVASVELEGTRTYLGVPMLKEDELLGAITFRRQEVRPFSDKQIALLQTFAAQAVIAIENVRLFKELQAQTAALSRSVSQLTALGEVGQAISSTLDLETVLQTIVSRALQLSGLDSGSIYEYDQQAQVFRLQATDNMPEEITEAVRASPIRAGDGLVGRTAVTHELSQVPDILDASYRSGRRDLLLRAGYRALLAVPLLREEQLLGVLLVGRKTPGAFAPEIVDLLKTFATQSALAIQNARLFREIAEKGRQLEVASQHKSHFLASMSHELRTPLNAMLGFNEMILGDIYGPVPEDLQSPLADIQSSGKHLLRLINNVLDLAKIEAGRMELSLAEYSVQDTVESVRSTLHPLAADKGLEFTVSIPENIPFAYGDFGRITQCLMNLAGNSLKFTRQGSVRIVVDLQDSRLVYRVIDTGIGIAPDKIESLFTEFKQTDATIASEFGGTGLGLSITRKFVEMHGGRIWVESKLGKGSEFVFAIPLRAGEGGDA